MKHAPTLAVRPPDIARRLADPLPTWRRAAVIATTGEGTITFWNAGAERLYGHPARAVRGRSLIDITPLGPARGRAEEILAYLQAGRPFIGEVVRRRRNGLPVVVYLMAFPIGDLAHGGGAIVGAIFPIAQRDRVWRDAPRVYAEILRRFGGQAPRYLGQRREPPLHRIAATLPDDRVGVYIPVRNTHRLAAIHRNGEISREQWRLMQRVEAYRLRAERLARPHRRPRFGEAALSRMWLRLAEHAVARKG